MFAPDGVELVFVNIMVSSLDLEAASAQTTHLGGRVGRNNLLDIANVAHVKVTEACGMYKYVS